MADEPVPFSLDDREKIVKSLRHTAFSVDKLCGTLLELTQRLEDSQLIASERPTKRLRDKQIKRHRSELQPDEKLIADVLEQVKDHPDPEAIVASLFRDLEVPRVKRIAAAQKSGKKADATEEADPL
jgi:hypothetical protein